MEWGMFGGYGVYQLEIGYNEGRRGYSGAT